MYISHQAQQVVHQDIVDDGLRRSERRRLLKSAQNQTRTEAQTQESAPALRRVLGGMVRAVVRI